MKTVWVTSFSAKLYEASGRELVESYVRTGSCGIMVVAPEGLNGIDLPESEGNVSRLPDLSTDIWLTDWLRRYAKHIPVDLGGKWSGPCKCKHPGNPHARHKLPCPGYWFCRHASRWYRKIVALKRVLDTAPCQRRLVWVDADVVFDKRVDESVVDSWFGEHDLFYLKGPKREEWETGVVGYQGLKGLDFIETIWNRYLVGLFLKDSRWDDCYQSRMALKTRPDVRAVDLATGSSGHSDVVPHSPLGRYLSHFKGRHGRVLGIMK
jgi:hypothetical protein